MIHNIKQPQAAAQEYLARYIIIDKEKKEIALPSTFKWYSEDFGSPTSFLSWIKDNLDDKKRKDFMAIEASGADSFRFYYDWRVTSPSVFRQSFNL